MAALTISTAVHPTSTPSQELKPLFANKPNADLYWKALLQIAKNNKEEALKIVAAIKSNAPAPTTQEQADPFDAFFDELFIASVHKDPERLTDLGLFESIGIHEHNAHLNDVSQEAIRADVQKAQEQLHRLKQFSYKNLSSEQKVSHKMFHWLLTHTVAGEPFLFHDYKVNQMFGTLLNQTILFTQFHPLKTAEDVEHYLTRLSRIPEQLQQTISLLEHQLKNSIKPPLFTIIKVKNMLQKLMPQPATDHVFYKNLAGHVEKIDMHDKDKALTRTEAVLQNQIYPAYQSLLEFFTKLHDQTDTNHGVWALPAGDDYYAHMLKQHTTTDLSPDQIHELGLKEVEKIHTEMRAILAREGITDPNKTAIELFNSIANDPRFFYPETDEGRKQCLADYYAILDRCRTELYPLFDLKPKSSVKVSPVPKHEEEGAPGAYYFPPSMDGSRPGTFFANLRSMKETPKYGMETLTIHEGEPGHHFQVALQQESDMHIMRKIPAHYTAYLEGWALYAEKLAYEQDFYSSSFAQIGHLQGELMRAARLVVDTGIHKKRWTREQAIDYMEAATGMDHGSVVTEIERYFVLPGQACAYKIGQLKILELRDRARKALGDKFDIRKFHNVVLGVGACPLTILEEVVDEYIQTAQR